MKVDLCLQFNQKEGKVRVLFMGTLTSKEVLLQYSATFAINQTYSLKLRIINSLSISVKFAHQIFEKNQNDIIDSRFTGEIVSLVFHIKRISVFTGMLILSIEFISKKMRQYSYLKGFRGDLMSKFLLRNVRER